jgi:hypothetical protein
MDAGLFEKLSRNARRNYRSLAGQIRWLIENAPDEAQRGTVTQRPLETEPLAQERDERESD